MKLFENVQKLTGVIGLLKAFNGKKTLTAQIVVVVAAVWSLLMPGTAPTPAQLTGAADQGVELYRVIHTDVIPKIIELFGSVAGFFFALHSQSKFGNALRTIVTLTGKFIDHNDLDDPHLVETLKATPIQVTPPKPQPQPQPAASTPAKP